MNRELFVELAFSDQTVRLGTGGPSADGLLLSSSGVEGWWSTPEAKVQMTEMQTGDGAHAVEDGQVLDAARTVTIGWIASGALRDSSITAVLDLLNTSHRLVRVRVVDGMSDTFVTGYTLVSTEAGRVMRFMRGTLTVVCADPRRYSTALRQASVFPASESPGGLSYGAGSTAGSSCQTRCG